MTTSRISSFNNSYFCQALPPKYQEEAERHRIENDPKLQELIGNSVYRIDKTETGYLVATDGCEIPITIKYLPLINYGPAQFEVVFGDVIKRHKSTSFSDLIKETSISELLKTFTFEQLKEKFETEFESEIKAIERLGPVGFKQLEMIAILKKIGPEILLTQEGRNLVDYDRTFRSSWSLICNNNGYPSHSYENHCLEYTDLEGNTINCRFEKNYFAYTKSKKEEAKWGKSLEPVDMIDRLQNLGGCWGPLPFSEPSTRP